MKHFARILSLLFLLFITIDLSAQAQLKFVDAKKNFGFVKQGKLVEIKYEFKNTGNQPLILIDYKVECSCTTVEFSKDPVMPGKSGFLVVKFDTKTVFDRQDRVVEILSNASPQKIRFKGVVLQ